ncbi:MAG: 7,8-didemethyl-8-hydroxy-5-deazariboflavin synthase subunit CofG [Methanotrichaceae archaeon]
MIKKRLTYSRNVFIPVTDVCRNRCSYCSFRSDKGKIISRKDALCLMNHGSDAGCTEALFSSGERPWDIIGFEKLLQKIGKNDFVDYLIELCELALERNLLPHTNIGVLNREEMARLAPYNASMGLMLETTAEVKAHRNSPGKDPKIRIEAIAAAGELRIPFTTGILVGIGEAKKDRLKSLQVLADLHRTYDHIQEVIIQPFDPKPGTTMAHLKPPSIIELAETVKFARKILPSSVAVQVPPNLINPRPLVEAGADDLGGISPVTLDWINPQKPWPSLDELRMKLRDFELRERLPVYPRYIKMAWHGNQTQNLVKKLAGPGGLNRK